MKTQLPPELVEKMAIHVILARDYVRPTVDCVNECAQIAVDFNRQHNDALLTNYIESVEKSAKLLKQRDELLEALREASEYLPYIKKEDFKKLINRING